MKKAYLYFLIPLLGLAAFGAVYWQFSSGYEQRQEQRARAERQKKEAKLQEDARNREKAVMEAKEAQEKRRAEKAAKEARDTKDKEDRELAKQALRKAQIDSDKLDGQVRRLTKEIDETKKEIAKIEDEKTRSVSEEKFLKEYVKQAEANRANLLAVVEKIDAADKAAEAAAKEAAAAAKKK
jgi:hypothetical protein